MKSAEKLTISLEALWWGKGGGKEEGLGGSKIELSHDVSMARVCRKEKDSWVDVNITAKIY